MKCLVVILLLSGCALAQTATVQNPSAPAADEGFAIAPDDVLEVAVSGAPEFGGTPKVNASGYITLPHTGGFKAAGLNSVALAKEIEGALLSKKYLVAPNVVVSVKERALGQASVLGAVRSPSIVPLKGPRVLMDVLAAVGGPTDNAGKTIQVFRKVATQDAIGASGPASTATKEQVLEVSTEELFQKGNTDLNILIYPGDIVNVLQTASVFVVGDVKTPGEFPLKFGRGITVRQAVALAGSFNREARQEDCKIIRYRADGTQEEIPMNLKKIMQDTSLVDPPLMPNDILFVPSSKAKGAINKALDVAIGVVTQRAIYIGR